VAEMVTALVLVACVGVSVLALVRGWSPPLLVSVGIGLGLRILVVYLAYGHTPYDVAVVFHHVGRSVLHREDPLTSLPRYEWHFLPFSAYLLAAELKTGLPWQVAVKLLPVSCDVATIGLVGRFARPPVRGNAQLIYALLPLAILVSAWHGQIEPIAIALGLSALLLARQRRVLWAGIALGLAIASKTWPALFAPGVLSDIPRTRWWQAAAAAVAVIAALLASIRLFLHDSLRHAVPIINYGSFVGSWGWTGVLRYLQLAGAGFTGPRVDEFQHLGTLLTVVTLAVVLLVFRRCSAPDLTLALLLAFLAVTAGFGPQYLLWPAALLCASRRPAWYVYLFLASAYTGFFYLYAYPNHESLNSWPGALLQVGSILLIAAAIASMPWSELRPSGGRSAQTLARQAVLPRERSAQAERCRW
jgi:Glycosyltransferase family 87